MRILQISDCHLAADTEYVGYGGIKPYQSLERVMQACVSSSPDLILITGDISNDDSRQSYELLNQLLNRYFSGVPFYVLPGNHDKADLMLAVFGRQHSWLMSPLKRDNWVIHLWNSQTDKVSGEISEQQLQVFEQTLAAHPKDSHLIALHHPPVAMHSWMDDIGLLNGQQVMDKLQAHGNVRAVVFGHVHTAREQQFGQLSVLACPSTCWQWAQEREFGLDKKQPAAARLVQLGSEGRVTSHLIEGDSGQ